jgi:pyruvate dehydrogenase E2 component (dihydrolipoamide acetyltransferase)
MDVLMPQLGETVAEGKIITWFKSVGDPVATGDNLFEVETDKTAMDVPSTVTGVITEIRAGAGETVPVGAVVAVIGDGAGSVAVPLRKSIAVAPTAPAEPTRNRAAPVPPAALSASAAASNLPQAPMPYDPFREVRAPARNYGRARLPDGSATTPLARRLAAEAGIDLRSIRGSGPHGRVSAKDVERYGAGPAAATAIPHSYLRREVWLDALLTMIERVNAHNTARPVSLRDCVVKALARALTEIPEANVQWVDGRKLQFDNADIAVAVNTATIKVVRAAEGKGLGAIAGELATPADTTASTVHGVSTVWDMSATAAGASAPAIRPPHITALAIGAIGQTAAAREGHPPAEIRGTLTLCCDHRAIDDAVGARLISACAAVLERPMLLML